MDIKEKIEELVDKVKYKENWILNIILYASTPGWRPSNGQLKFDHTVESNVTNQEVFET